MASRFAQSVVGVMLAGSLLASSTAAVAANAQPAPQANPWAVLAVMSGGAPAAAVCASAIAAAAGTAAPGGCVLPVVDAAPVPIPAPPPPPLVPVAAASAGAGISPLLIALLAVVAGVGALLAIHHNGTPNSPA